MSFRDHYSVSSSGAGTMLTSSVAQYINPDYLQPLPTTVSFHTYTLYIYLNIKTSEKKFTNQLYAIKNISLFSLFSTTKNAHAF